MFSISITLLWCAAAWAQKPYLPSGWTGHKPMNLEKAITDTLDDHFDSATVTVYVSPNGGFVSGNSGYNETAKLQEFDVDTSYVIEGFLYWFAYKEQQSLNIDSSSLTLTFWRMDSSGTVGGVSRLLPRTVLMRSDLLIQDLDTSVNFGTGVNVWSITPTPVYNNYGVGFTMENLHEKDTIALYSSTDGDPPIPTLSWEKWNNYWNTIYNTWGLDIDLAIFPLVDYTSAGIEDEYFVENLKLSFYPNPCSDALVLEYATAQYGRVDLCIWDAGGKLQLQKPLGNQPVGQYRQELDISSLTPGVYYLSLGLDGRKRITKKLVKN